MRTCGGPRLRKLAGSGIGSTEISVSATRSVATYITRVCVCVYVRACQCEHTYSFSRRSVMGTVHI